MNSLQKIIGWLPQLLAGAKITILLTLCSVTAGLLIGILLAVGKMSKYKGIRGFCSAYTFFFVLLPRKCLSAQIMKPGVE